MLEYAHYRAARAYAMALGRARWLDERMKMAENTSRRAPDGAPSVEQVRSKLDALGTKLQRDGATSSDLKKLDDLYKTYLDVRTTEPPAKGLSFIRRLLFGE